MNRTAKVTLYWIEKPLDRPFPRAQKFSRPARFDHQGEDWKHDAWSLTVITEGAVDEENHETATANFLVPDAPHDWLSVGRHFTLFEGELALAECVVEEILPRAEHGNV
jgi:hypothetical protein